MRETRADDAQALLLALGLHVLLFALMFAGLWWSRTPPSPSAAGAPAGAELVDASELSEAMQRTLAERPEPAVEPLPAPLPEPVEEETAPLPQPLPEPVPQEAPVPAQPQAQDFIPEPDTQAQEAVVDQPTPRSHDDNELREARRRQEQIDLTEQRRQEDVQRQKRLAKMEAERKAQLAEIRRQRAAASREAEAAEQRLRQVADARAAKASATVATPAPPGNAGTDTGLQARYAAALQEAILAKWTRPETVPVGARCRLIIRQLPGGEVMSAEVASPCAYDEQGRRSIEAAVLKAQPLPYAGFETVFSRTLTLNFEARDR
ncbi:MAG: cell envelope integrity protein TolA [Proteobacteria bacterium]|nr:cell envelope integrity protein TolA [Pseudomonadota bacterium]